MTNEQLVNWCSTRFKNYYRVAAILSLFSPDEDELNEWSIEEYDSRYIVINNCDYYKILTEYEVEDEIADIKHNVRHDLEDSFIYDISDYVDWDSYWRDNSLTAEDDLDLPYTIKFEGITYYYNEYTNQC